VFFLMLRMPGLREELSEFLLSEPLIFGDPKRVHRTPTVQLGNARLNVISGDITLEDWAFCGLNVSLLTGTHDPRLFGHDRQHEIPLAGRDIVIKEGAWIASNATVLGPCTIGAHSVVAANSVVLSDVPPYTMVAGNPARVVRTIPHGMRAEKCHPELVEG
jgi:acetyltransferase-like isoleucine patch superfamily enzyme